MCINVPSQESCKLAHTQNWGEIFENLFVLLLLLCVCSSGAHTFCCVWQQHEDDKLPLFRLRAIVTYTCTTV